MTEHEASAADDPGQGPAAPVEALAIERLPGLVIDALPVLIAYVDARQRYRFVNRAYEEWFGRPRAEVVGRTMREVLGEAACEAVRPHVEAALAGRAVAFRTLVPYRHGGPRRVEARYEPHRGGADGQVLGFYALVTDVTGRERAEAALRESEERYRALVEMSPDAVHVHRDGVIILANRQAAALFGAAGPEDLIGRRALSLVDRSTLGTAQARTAKLRAPGDRNEPVELTIRRLDGGSVVAEAGSAAVLLDGRLAIQAVLRDVTARKRAEAELRRSELQLRLALDAAGLGVWDLDYASGRLDCDRRFRAMYALPPEGEVAGGALWARVHPDDAPRVRAAVERAKDPASGGAYEAEYRAVLPDGAERWHLARAQAYFEGEGAARRVARIVGVVMDATERRRAEEALRASEATLRAFYDSAPVMMGVVEPLEGIEDLLHVDDNAAACRFFGVPPGSTAGRTARALGVSAETVRAWTARYRESRGRSTSVRFDHEFHGPDDSRLLAVAVAHVGPGASGRERFCYVAEDATERRRAEAALAESEARLRLATAGADVGTWELDLVSGRGRWSAEAVALFGVDRSDFTATDWIEAVHPADRGGVATAWRRAVEEGAPYEVECRAAAPAPDGGERWLLSRGGPERDAAGRPTRGAGVVLDITARRRAEAALRDSEARYRATQEHAGVGIGEADADGRFLRANAALCAITGYPREELLGRTVFDVTHPEDAAAEREEYARLVSGEAATYAREKRYVRRDGAERWVEVAATAVRDPDGRFLRGVRVVQDVNDRKLAEERQRLLLAELSHRVKNTLAVVQSIANRSLAGDRTLREGRETLAKRLRALAGAHTLLTASEWRGASLRALAAAELGPYRERAEAKGADVALGPKAAQSLALILHELATNAAKHGALSAAEGRVQLAWAVEGPTWRLAWREAGGPEVSPPSRRGFGRLLVEDAAAHDLGGRARLEFRREGLVYELEAPLARLLAA